MSATIHHGDCLDVLRAMPDNSVDAVVCDPPYGLSNTSPDKVTETIVRWAQGDREYVPQGRGFMGASWDAFVPPVAVWDECLRVLRPGGHLVAFAGSRTQDLMGLAIRLAGFDIRENLAWLYGSGFPKSLDVGKAIDKMRDDLDDVHAVVDFLRANLPSKPDWTAIDGACGCPNTRQKFFARSTNGMKSRCPTWEQWEALKALLGLSDDMDAEVWRLNGRKGTPGENWDKREVIGSRTTGAAMSRKPSGVDMGTGGTVFGSGQNVVDVTAPATPEAERWQGWGTALKPAHEPIILARKPFPGTVAQNTLTWGTGGLNIDATRIGNGSESKARIGEASQDERYTEKGGTNFAAKPGVRGGAPNGRWPANVVLDPDTAPHLDEQSEGASRFFKVVEPAPPFMYAAKAPKKERPTYTTEDGQTVQHATVKPLSIMQWLVKLVTPEGGTVLDPFAGSGTTVEAAILEGFNVIGIEREAEYLPLIQQRIDRATDVLPMAS